MSFNLAARFSLLYSLVPGKSTISDATEVLRQDT